MDSEFTGFDKVVKDKRKKLESEKDTEKYLSQRIRKYGGQSYKWSSPGQRAVPDRICVLRSGVVIFVEIKSEGKKLSPLQDILHKQLLTLVDNVYVVDTKAKVDYLISTLIRIGVM